VPTYRLHDDSGDDLGVLEHPAPNIEPGDAVVLSDGREALVTARVEAKPGPRTARLEVWSALAVFSSSRQISKLLFVGGEPFRRSSIKRLVGKLRKIPLAPRDHRLQIVDTLRHGGTHALGDDPIDR
jgi:hypothetical protein